MSGQSLIGRRFGRLTVVGPARCGKKSIRPASECQCDCGKIKVVRSQHLLSGHTSSCGCLVFHALQTKHGGLHKSEYTPWRKMRRRCQGITDKDYHRYGAKGIVVCERWGSFENFLADMGSRPSLKHTIDRIDNSKGYEPSNCRWATMTEQNRNKPSCKLSVEAARVILRLRQFDMPLNDICQIYGVRRGIIDRIIAGKAWQVLP